MENLERNLSMLGAEHKLVYGSQSGSPQDAKMSSWIKPPTDSFKFNVDAVVEDAHSTIAIVARDWRRIVVLALSKKVYATIPLQAEAEALVWALTVSVDLNLERVYFESDSKICVDSLSGASAPHWRIAGLVSDLILTAASHPHWSFVWTKREANCVTHVLAGWSQRCLWGLFGSDSGPSCFLLACSENLK